MITNKKPNRRIALTALALGAGLAAVGTVWWREATINSLAGNSEEASRPSPRQRAEQASERDWRTQVQRMISLADDMEREDALRGFTKEKSPQERAELVRFLWNQHPSEACREAAKRLIRQLAELHPEEAAELAGKLPPDSDRDAAMLEVATVWAAADFQRSLDWINQWPDGENRIRALTGAGYEAARSDSWAALKLATSLPSGETRDALIHHAAAQCSTEDPQAVAEWARQLDDRPLRERTIGTVATEWSDRDPVAAASFALEQLPAGRVLDDTLVGIVQRWVQTEPEAARAWVRQFPSGPLRDTALEQIVALHP